MSTCRASRLASDAAVAVGALVATRIERKPGNGAPAPALRFWGTVEAMPEAATAPVGLWRIGGRLVSVSASTAIRQNDGMFEPAAGGVVFHAATGLKGNANADVQTSVRQRQLRVGAPGPASAR